jgi:hypothetical protein
VDTSDIRDAIVLFQYSQTGQGDRAREVVRVLWDLFRRNEIGFHVLQRQSLRGTWRAGRAGHDLRLNSTYFNGLPPIVQLGRLSLLLVHEGTHATVDFTKLYDEMAARQLPIHYYRELTGPGVFNEANDPPRPGREWGIVRLPPGSLPEFEEQSEALRRDRLIDYILGIDSYTRPRYIDPQWIIDNLNNWRGLRNRLPETRGIYIRVLASTVDTYFARAILDVMESVTNRQDWNAMMDKAGPLNTIRVVLDDLSARPQYARRIVALERQWGVHLRERPPVR